MQRTTLWAVFLLAMPFLAGFDLSRSSIPVEDILSGGPPKDGIPALLAPKFVPADQASYLQPRDRVIGVVRAGLAKAYPLRILNWHEVVNDSVGPTAIAVTYCPLTGSGVVFDRAVNGRTISFGVSGRLYQSNVLLYDHQTESLWSQLKAQAVTGPERGAQLLPLPSVTTTWGAWRRAHPSTLVLSDDTGHARDYTRNPYAGYEQSPEVMFPSKRVDTRLPAKERVLGVEVGGQAKAYPLARVERAGTIDDEIGGMAVRIESDAAARTARIVRRADGKPVPTVTAYWFAWSAFHPDTAVWGPPRPSRTKPAAPTGTAKGIRDVAIPTHAANWTTVFGLSDGSVDGGDAPSLLVVSGEIRNVAPYTLDHVKLAFELLDANGRVVAREEGYNLGAEGLRRITTPVPVPAEGPASVTPVPKGGTDTFRMMFFRDETPPFHAYRIRVLEAPPTP